MRIGDRVLVSVVVMALVVVACVPMSAVAAPRSGGRRIVTFAAGTDSDALLARVSLKGGRVKHLPLVNGALVEIPDAASERALAALPGVLSVEEDVQVDVLGKPANGTSKPSRSRQTLPWGVDLIDAELVWNGTTGDPIKVAVVDTGIDASHPDLADNVKGGASMVAYTTSWSDDNGHGTHVAGTIAAANNAIGVAGVAPSADLYAVKVLDRTGSGWVSDIIEALGWCVAGGMDVVNMSLGASSYVEAFDTAVQEAVDSGIVVVAAAGNSGPGEGTVSYPAKFARVIGVGATDSSDNVAWFSSRGSEVDVSAPGVSIYSTYPRGRYVYMSGTSMAAPHVTGTVALVLTTAVGIYDTDGLGAWDPAEVQAKLEATTLDLGPTGWDSAFGHGRVRADLAVAP